MTKHWSNLKKKLAKNLVRQRPLTWNERITTRIGYMGAGFVMAGQWTIEPILFIMGFVCVIIQVASRKQWNLVALNLNGLIAWTIHFFK